MLFNSVSFLAFFPAVLLVYFVIPKKCRYIWLLVSSYYFYMSWNPVYALLILFSSLITYVCGLLLGGQQEKRRKIRTVLITVACNLLVLFVFKYLDFTMEAFHQLLQAGGIRTIRWKPDLLLPVGISFYTFQTIGYVVDVYRGDTEAEHNFVRYALFVSFFPQLVAGPIERSKSLLSQLDSLKTKNLWSRRQVVDGLLLMLWGYFQKVVIADRVAVFVNQVYGHVTEYQGFTVVLATVFFSVQIYCDFAGYTNIARGAARMMGVQLMKNFEQPYFADSLKDFWDRWHISLSSWFRDYLYIPLGGSRKGFGRKLVNLMIIFAASGLWHGAAYTYIVWGLLHGIFRVTEELSAGVRRRMFQKGILKSGRQPSGVLRRLITFCFVDFAWIFFAAGSLHEAFLIIRQMVSAINPWIFFDGSLFTMGLDAWDFMAAVFAILVLFTVDFLQFRKYRLLEFYHRQNVLLRVIFVYAMTFTILIFGSYGPGYQAAQFIYFQF